MTLTLKRVIVNLLDRPGGRTLLGWAGTHHFRKLTGRDVSLFWDGSWFSRDGSEYVSDGTKFNYYKKKLLEHSSRLNRLKTDGQDYWFYKYQPKNGDVIVDVGAGSGHETGLFSRSVGDAGIVVAVEAHPKTYERLQKTCKYNRYENVVPVNCAIMDRRGSLRIEDNSNDEANAICDDSESEGFVVEGLTLDDLCRELSIAHIDFLKMNIEGAEQWAILGMEEMIRKTDFVAIACHDFLATGVKDERFCTRETIRQFLLKNGFDVVDRADDPRPYVRDHLHAWRSSR